MAENRSFLPEDYLEKKVQRRTNVICVTLFVIVLGGVVGGFYVSDRQTRDVHKRQREVGLRYEEAAKRLSQLDQLQEQKTQMMRKAQVTGSLLERIPRSLILSELINNMPTTLSLLDLDMQTRTQRRSKPKAQTMLDVAKNKSAAGVNPNQPMPQPDVDPTDVKLELIGIAPTDVQVAQFISSLNQADLFIEIELIFSQEVKIDDHMMRKFRIAMTLDQEVVMNTLEPKKVRRSLIQDPMGSTIMISADGSLVIPDDENLTEAPTTGPQNTTPLTPDTPNTDPQNQNSNKD